MSASESKCRFSGDFHFGYRDIPLREGESLVNPSVAERGVAFSRGNQTSLEPGTAGTFGVERRGDTVRIVWYFDARDQTRAFTVSYTLAAFAVAYDDVVDVNLKVWGDQWDEPLVSPRRRSRRRPGKILRAWGKPVWVRGDVELTGTRATLRAVGVPAHQFVELRTLDRALRLHIDRRDARRARRRARPDRRRRNSPTPTATRAITTGSTR